MVSPKSNEAEQEVSFWERGWARHYTARISALDIIYLLSLWCTHTRYKLSSYYSDTLTMTFISFPEYWHWYYFIPKRIDKHFLFFGEQNHIWKKVVADLSTFYFYFVYLLRVCLLLNFHFRVNLWFANSCLKYFLKLFFNIGRYLPPGIWSPSSRTASLKKTFLGNPRQFTMSFVFWILGAFITAQVWKLSAAMPYFSIVLNYIFI